MGKQSSLGPIDPQFFIPGVGQVAALGVIEEVERAMKEIKLDMSRQVFWANIFQKYNPTFIGTCEKAIAWSEEITTQWLQDCMFKGQSDAKEKAEAIVSMIASHKETKSHSRHLSSKRCKDIGLIIEDLEQDQKIQDAVLSIHHACMITLQNPTVIKIIENQEGKNFITRMAMDIHP